MDAVQLHADGAAADVPTPAPPPVAEPSGPWAPDRTPPHASRLNRWLDKIEAFISRLSVRDNFWQRICSLIWLPYAFFSGIKVKALDSDTFAAVLPFRRFNRNWYHAMAGGALLANSEIAGGMYLFGTCGGNFAVVCKELNYTFLRPCYGPALYHIKPREDIKPLLAAMCEFNITLDLEILQQVNRPGEKDRRVGRSVAVFHVTPKSHYKSRSGSVRRQR
ncbi:MAG TPA: hypothetical protein VMD30_06435 [Tepidisphaeraceae bacterium]|nr:hypothetical protein [Tepidisphaeraceae bacterium]